MKIFLLICFILVSATLAAGTDRYVDNICTNGTTYNPIARACVGGSSLVYSTIANGIAAMASGDTLKIRGGTYAERIIGLPSGSAGARTIIEAYGTEVVNWRPGGANGTATVLSLVGNEQYITIRGDPTAKNLVMDCQGGAANCAVMALKNTIATSNIIFDGITAKGLIGFTIMFVGDPTPGANLSNGGGYTFRNCHVWNGGSYTTNQEHGFYVVSHGNTIEDCELDHIGGFGIHNYEPSAQPSNNIYQRNFIHDTGNNVSSTAAILLTSGNNNQALYNRLARNVNGLGIGGGTGNKLIGNSLFDNGTNGTAWDCNIGVDFCSNPIKVDAAAVNSIVANNIVYGNWADAITNSGSGTVQVGNRTSDPRWANAPGDNFALCTAAGIPSVTCPGISGAINLGIANIAPGVTIPACSGIITTNCFNGSAPDQGAVESGSPSGQGPPTLTPNLTTVAANAAIMVTVDDDDVNERVEDIGDWVAMSVVGSASTQFLDWFYMNGSKTAPVSPISDAVLTFTAPAIAGAYEFRFFRNNSDADVDKLAIAPFTVTAPGLVMKFNISTIKIGPSVTWKIGTP